VFCELTGKVLLEGERVEKKRRKNRSVGKGQWKKPPRREPFSFFSFGHPETANGTDLFSIQHPSPYFLFLPHAGLSTPNG
jgi:hypothetical protein